MAEPGLPRKPWGLVKWLAMVGSSVAGLGVLIFTAGFLASRAQYEFAGVPFVFVDYWAYAETGGLALLTSLNLFLQQPLVLAAIAIISSASILGLENRRFKRWLSLAHWNWLGYILVLGFASLLVHQEFTIVRSLATHRFGATESAPRDWEVPGASVPAVFPFRYFIERIAEIPSAEPIVAESAGAGWRRMADALERDLPSGPEYLRLRPRPRWATTYSAPQAEGNSTTLLGAAVPTYRLDESRANDLYRAIFCSFLLCLWALLLMERWLRLVRDRARSMQSESGDSVLIRLQQELWFSARWVARPVTSLVVLSCGLLLPECYGVLAKARLGQELVEVQVESTLRESAAEPTTRITSEDLLRYTALADRAKATLGGTLQRYMVADVGPERDAMLTRWKAGIDQLGEIPGQVSIETLSDVARMSAVLSASLERIALRALDQARAGNVSSRSGYILHYPRSNTDLRVVQRNRLLDGTPWTIHPVPMRQVSEIRVQRAEQTRSLISLLRQLAAVDPNDRDRLIEQVFFLGHPWTLEVFLIGSLDDFPDTRGPAITAVGNYAQSLPRTAGGDWRRERAARTLLNIVQDPTRRVDHRGGAATAIRYVLRGPDSNVCSALLEVLELDGATLNDPYWELRGTLLTSLSKLQYPELRPVLLKLLNNEGAENTPEDIRASIPTALATLEGSPAVLTALKTVLEDPATDEALLGTAISAFGNLGYADIPLTIAAQDTLLARSDLVHKFGDGRATELRIASIDMLRIVGDRRAQPILERHVQREHEPSETVRAKAAIGLGELGIPTSQSLLLRIARDVSETPAVRSSAIDALGRVADHKGVVALDSLYSSLAGDDAPRLRQGILEALESLALAGSGRARRIADSHAEDTEAAQSVEALKAGDLGPFITYMSTSYYSQRVWEEDIVPRFPDIDVVQLRTLVASGRQRQDIVAGIVRDNRESLVWSPVERVYRLPEAE